MRVTVTKLTDIGLLHKACEATMHRGKSKMSLDAAYKSEHSIIRTQMFWVEMEDVPTFVSVHLVRHQAGITPYVVSNRDDRGGHSGANRMTPVKHSFICNAQSLINMSKKRLCGKAHVLTYKAMILIRDAVRQVDPDLHRYMVRECVYRNGICPEPISCGNPHKPVVIE